MHSMMFGGVENIFERSKVSNNFGVNPKLEEQIKLETLSLVFEEKKSIF